MRLILAGVAWFWASVASAHDARPLAVFLDEEADGRVSLAWKAPGSIDLADAPELAIAGRCSAIVTNALRGALAGRAYYQCSRGLEGAKLTIRYPAYNPSVSTLVRLSRRSGETTTEILKPGVSEWIAPKPETLGSVSRSYFGLGVEHILIGIDHILFLFGLMALSGTPRRVVITATGFTLAHSITLALVALDAIRVSIPAVETLIALSILFVAAEVARGRRPTIAWRRPVVVASAFGLLHGAGFAAALGEIGLPQTERTAALLFFNVGVEAGQILIIAAAFAALAALRLLLKTPQAQTPRTEGKKTPRDLLRFAFSYGLGTVSAYWFIERAAAALA